MLAIGCWMLDVGCFHVVPWSVVCGLWSRVPSAFASGGFVQPIASISNFYFLLSAFARSAFLPSAFSLLPSPECGFGWFRPDFRGSRFEVQGSTLDVGNWQLAIGCWLLAVGYWLLDVRRPNMTADLVSRTVWATLLGDFAGSDKAVFHESRMIYQPDGEFPGFGWIEELLQAKPQEKDVGPRLGPDLQEQVNGALNQRLGFCHIPALFAHAAHNERQGHGCASGQAR
jgi:hypothetical protein